MNYLRIVFLSWAAVIAALIFPICTSNPDEITSLPGLKTKLYFKQYSGYLNATNGRKLHYWFVESEGTPSTDPLLLWLNGGPGCSSLLGLLGENGPLHVNEDGRTLYVNPYRWNKHANVLYLEAPAGVGYSYSDDHDYATDDDKVSEDNYVALQDFFRKYPSFKANDFYVTGESYGGIYVPTLSVRVLTGPADINFKGFVIGNGFLNRRYNGESLVFFAYHHGLIGEKIWGRLTKFCCDNNVSIQSCRFVNPQGEDCKNAVKDASYFISGLNIDTYNLYAPCVTVSSKNNSRYSADKKMMINSLTPSRLVSVRDILPCLNDSKVITYLNLPQTRQALHIPTSVPAWEECSSTVSGSYKELYDTMKPQFQQLLSSGRLRGLIYNGDVDMACNFMGDQWFVEDLGLPVVSAWKEWSHANQIAGFYKRFQNLSFVTIKGSGHMVPQDKPGEALQMISEYLQGKI